MSHARRKRDAIAPSLFPFLAVLLCTMGSLVLILMLIVSTAQADAKQMAEQAQQRNEEIESLAQHAMYSFQKKLDEGRLELEKKRLLLQHFEEHILELGEELEQLKNKAELARTEDQSEEDLQATEAAISELEKQLAEAKRLLEQELEKPDGDKPIFAIIPYEGPNGTHRRPIYLECVANGIIIQPEGNRLSLRDLQPPHGPGNPLDAALRAIRAEYTPANGAITRTAYPLLLVRPQGIRAYALARSAMNGWDDQFGYELIDGELELAFPDGVPGLQAKVDKAIELAKQRQTALVMAMPGRFLRQESALDGGLRSTGGGGGSYASPTNSGNAGYGSGSGSGSGYAGRDSGSVIGPGRSSRPTGSGVYGYGGSPAAPENGLDSQAGSAGEGPGSQRTSGELPIAGTQGNPGAGESYFGAGASNRDQMLAQGQMNHQGYGPAPGGTAGRPPGSDSYGPPPDGSTFQAGQGSETLQGGQGSDNSQASQGSAGSAGGSSKPGGRSSSGSGRQQGGQEMAGQSASASQGSAGSNYSASGGAQSGSDQAGTPQIAMNYDFTKQRGESARPVASSQGRNWAWSEGPRSQTPVVRAIPVHCFADRWEILPARGSEQSVVISYDSSPQERAMRLAQAVENRVQSWGLAIMGGYWKPVLVVDVDPGLDWRFNQLIHLLQGSGLEVRRKSATNQSAGAATPRRR